MDFLDFLLDYMQYRAMKAPRDGKYIAATLPNRACEVVLVGSEFGSEVVTAGLSSASPAA